MILMSWDTREQVERFIDDKASTDQLVQWCPETEVDNLVQHMKSEANRHWNIDPNISFKLSEGIIALGYHYKNISHVALGLMARGDARHKFGEFKPAWDDLEEAGRLFKSIGDDVGWARTRIGLVVVSFDLKKVKDVLPQTDLAETIIRREKAWHLLINLRMNLGAVHNWRADFDEALRQLRKAVRLAQCLGPKGEAYLGNLYLNIGYTFVRKDDFRQAEIIFEKALEFFTKRSEDFGIVYVELHRAYLAEMTGHLRKALQLLDSVVPRAERLSNYQAAQARTYMASCYLKLNRFSETRSVAKQVIQAYKEQEAAYGQALPLLQLARAETALGHYDQAKLALSSLEQLYEELGADIWKTRVDIWRALIALNENDALTAKHLAHNAAQRCLDEQQYVLGAKALIIEGQALLHLQLLKSGYEVATKALKFTQKYNLINYRYDAHVLLGNLSQAIGDIVRAKRHYQAAISSVDRMQRTLAITLRSTFLEDKQEAQRSLFGLHYKSGDIASAFETLERTKSQIFFGYLNSRDSLVWSDDHPRSRQLLDKLQQLREEHLWYYNILQGEAEKAKISMDEARHQLGVVERDLRIVTEQLYLQVEDIKTNISVPTLADIQLQLEDDTCLIEFYNDGNKIWVFFVSCDVIKIWELSTTVARIDELLRKYQFNVSVALKAGIESPLIARLEKQFRDIAWQLYNDLLDPIQFIFQSFSRLIIVPYGSLHYLPFHLLYNGQRYIIEHHEVVILPAAGLLVRETLQRPSEALVMAHSHNGHVPQTLAESNIVYDMLGGDLYCNEQAKRGVLQQSPRQVLHLAAHGEFRLDQPELSYIYLEDGPLYTDDLIQLDLSYELVTLSACETGRANIAPGDEPIGLGRGCLYAGARALLVSLWRVDDAATLRLMKVFYEALLSGKSKSDAIRSAQCALMQEKTSLHPAFWGAFQLIGNAEPLST